MKKFKIAFVLIIIAIAALFVYQNKESFIAYGVSFDFSVPILDIAYKTPEIYNGILFIGCFAFGFILSYILTLFGKFKDSKKIKELNITIRDLNITIKNYGEKIGELKKEIDQIKGPLKERDNQTAETESGDLREKEQDINEADTDGRSVSVDQKQV